MLAKARVNKWKFPDVRPAGAGLLAKASCQQMEIHLTEPVRQQAGSYRSCAKACAACCLRQRGCGRCGHAKVYLQPSMRRLTPGP
jgi:hypothetical protein